MTEEKLGGTPEELVIEVEVKDMEGLKEIIQIAANIGFGVQLQDNQEIKTTPSQPPTQG